MRKNDSAADLLICMTSVAACTDMRFDCLIKLCGSCLLYNGDSILHIIKVQLIIKLQCLSIFLAVFHNLFLLVVRSGFSALPLFFSLQLP